MQVVLIYTAVINLTNDTNCWFLKILQWLLDIFMQAPKLWLYILMKLCNFVISFFFTLSFRKFSILFLFVCLLVLFFFFFFEFNLLWPKFFYLPLETLVVIRNCKISVFTIFISGHFSSFGIKFHFSGVVVNISGCQAQMCRLESWKWPLLAKVPEDRIISNSVLLGPSFGGINNG